MTTMMYSKNIFSGKYWVQLAQNCPNPIGIQVSGVQITRGTNVLQSSSHLIYSTPPHTWLNIFLGFLERCVQISF